MKTDATRVTIARRPAVRIALTLAVAALFLAAAQSASAIEITKFYGGATASNGEPLTQAGGHPDLTVGFEVDTTADGSPNENFKDIEVDLPAGLVLDPTATPVCKQEKLSNSEGFAECPPSTQVGYMYITNEETLPIYNMEPPAGVPGRFAVNKATVLIYLDAKVRSDGDYGITSMSLDSSQSLGVPRVKTVLWGVPADPIHDPFRACGLFVFGCSSEEPRRPMISNPSDCTAGPMTTRIRMNSWQQPDLFAVAAFDRDPAGNPLQVTGCENVHFDPQLSVQPQSRQADSPTGLDVTLAIPQSRDPDGYATALLNRATVVFPPGMAVNPSSADGQASCSQAQIALKSTAPPSCPDASKIASVNLVTPLQRKPLIGSVYLAEQGKNPFGSTLAVYLVAEGSGVVVKVPGRIAPDPQTGRLTTVFDNNPQLPFETLTMSFKGGPRAPLVTPPRCGTFTTTGEFVPWSALDKNNPTADELRISSDAFQITSGPAGGPCPNGEFDPTMRAGTTNPVGGSYSPFVLRLHRDDGSERFQSLAVTLPEGLLGRLAGIPYCSDAALASVSGAEGAGWTQLRSPACSAASRVGTVSVGAGAGTNPFYANTGKAYLAGPYKGAPLSLAVVMPAIAGPFDLGSVVVRNALEIDPQTARLTAVSDPLPTILHGIPLDVRDIRIDIDRPGFTLNPTDCDPTRISGRATATTGAIAALENRFKAFGCGELGFKPKLAIQLSGKTHRSAHPALRATLTMPQGGANIQRAQVTLPKTEFLAQEHIRTICTRVQYAADGGGGKACPKASIYGYAKAWSPLLDQPLQGPVYLRSSSNPLPDLVASLDGQIHIDLSGRIDTKNARIRNTFDLVPDAPVSKFVLTMQGGKKGLLVNNTELCKAKPRADVKFDGQNGKTADSQPLVKVDCGKKRKDKKK